MKNKTDMIHGPLFSSLLLYAIPLMFSGLLQLMFNAADMAVVGKFTGSAALAAVSAASPVSNLIVQLFMGLSTGTNVFLAQQLGAGNKTLFQKGVHTSMVSALFFGVVLMTGGFVLSGSMLVWLHTPASVIDDSLLYLRIYLLGIPSLLVYNFGSAVLRACGDTRRPLLFMTLSGLMNVVLNLVFVIGFHGGVAGVSIATVISETFSAGMVLYALIRTDQIYQLHRNALRIDWPVLKKILWIGVPAGIQGSAFSIANLLIQSAINSFGPKVMAASAAAMNVDTFCYIGVDALGQGILTFTGQNYGAGNKVRIRQMFWIAMSFGVILQLILGITSYAFSDQVLSVFTSDPAVLSAGKQIMFPICVFAFVNTTINIPFHIVRGMGHSVFPMICTVLCVCVLRILWIYTVFPLIPTVGGLYAAWPVTKGITSVFAIIYYYRLIAG